MKPQCAATTKRGTRCSFPGRFDGYCGHHQRCEQCSGLGTWACNFKKYCRRHLARHLLKCSSCAGVYRLYHNHEPEEVDTCRP